MKNSEFESRASGLPRCRSIRFSFHPQLERLEARSTPATITVNDIGDTIAVDNKVTLREAVASVNDGKNINADVVAVGISD